jgi:hypothetical protein
MDYRISPSLESINFVFDSTTGDPVLYKTVAKPARPQAQGGELTFVFAPLDLKKARDQYRIILVGDQQAKFAAGSSLTGELRINAGEGYNRPPERPRSNYDVEGQRNFAFDFNAPEDINAINDIRVSVRSTQPIRSAILYVRSRLTSESSVMYSPPPRPVRPDSSTETVRPVAEDRESRDDSLPVRRRTRLS